jgi:osmotically-inducible protein OsmY
MHAAIWSKPRAPRERRGTNLETSVHMKTDQQLKQDITHELQWEPSVTETHIGVTVKNGIVTLSGHVPTWGEKYGSEKAVKRVAGVKAVANELDVKIASDRTRTDEDIAIACVNALRESSTVPDDAVKVMVSGGWVTLEGTVEWMYQREAAEKATCNIIGVRGLTNDILLTPRATSGNVKEEIEAAFKRSAEVDAKHIVVEARDGKVKLFGQVRSWSEKREAQHAAWAAPGVTSVENNLVVVE